MEKEDEDNSAARIVCSWVRFDLVTQVVALDNFDANDVGGADSGAAAESIVEYGAQRDDVRPS